MWEKYGVEKSEEEHLKGKPGGKQVEVNARGQVVRTLQTVDPTPGDNVWLTIDIDLQKKAEALLDGLVGAVVAVEPDTGEVLAMASSPSFDQNGFVDGMSRDEWRDLVFKSVSSAAEQSGQRRVSAGIYLQDCDGLGGIGSRRH